MANSAPPVPDHIFISEGVLTGVYGEKKSKMFDKNAVSFYLLLVKYRNINRDFFVRNSTLTDCLEMHTKEPFQPGVIEALQGVELADGSSLEETEYILTLASRIAARKSPQTFAYLATPEEKKEMADVVKAKNFNLQILSTVDLLGMCGVDYPLRTGFMGKLKDNGT